MLTSRLSAFNEGSTHTHTIKTYISVLPLLVFPSRTHTYTYSYIYIINRAVRFIVIYPFLLFRWRLYSKDVEASDLIIISSSAFDFLHFRWVCFLLFIVVRKRGDILGTFMGKWLCVCTCDVIIILAGVLILSDQVHEYFV